MKITKIHPYTESPVEHSLPVFDARIQAGFPSPAEDEYADSLNLQEFLTPHPDTTFFLRVEGDSMIEAGIFSGDMLVVDRSLGVKQDDVVVAIIDGEFTVKRYQKHPDGIYFLPENSEYSPIVIQPDSEIECEIWGVVTYVIHRP